MWQTSFIDNCENFFLHSQSLFWWPMLIPLLFSILLCAVVGHNMQFHCYALVSLQHKKELVTGTVHLKNMRRIAFTHTNMFCIQIKVRNEKCCVWLLSAHIQTYKLVYLRGHPHRLISEVGMHFFFYSCQYPTWQRINDFCPANRVRSYHYIIGRWLAGFVQHRRVFNVH